MAVVKVQYELTLSGKTADGAMEAWLQEESEDNLKEYFIEYLSEKLKDGDCSGFRVLNAKAEWRPAND